MWRRILLSALFIAGIVITAYPGNSVRLSGSITAADLAHLAESQPELTTLDLSGTTIASYSGEALPLTGRKSSPANTIPECAFAQFPHITSIILPSGITAIDYAAFAGCRIESLQLPDGLLSIGADAFRGSAIRTIILPESVSEIGESAFANCAELESAVLPAGLSCIPYGTFSGCGRLTDVAIPKSVLTIGAEAFRSTALQAIDLSANKGLTRIGTRAFAECRTLESAVLPPRLTEIESSTFLNARALRNIVLPADCEFIDDCAFALCPDISEIKADQAKHIPLTGQDVWHGLNQSEVPLYVPQALTEAFRSDAEWGKFNVIGDTGSIGITVGDADGNGQHTLRATTADASTILVTTDIPMLTASAHYTSGILLGNASENSTSVYIKTLNHSQRIVIVTVTLTDGTTLSTKLIAR